MNVIVSGIDLSDGKDVLLLAPTQIDAEDAQQLITALNDRFPNSNFMVLTEGFGIVVGSQIKEILQDV